MSLLYVILIIVVVVLLVYLLCRLLGVDAGTRNVIYALVIIASIIWILKGYVIK